MAVPAGAVYAISKHAPFSSARDFGTTAMHQYTCPKCKTILKRQEPVPPGKKIKCPKCETIFDPPTAVTAAKPAKAVKAAKVAEEDPDRIPYRVQVDEEQEDLLKNEKQRAAMGIIKDRYKKSAR